MLQLFWAADIPPSIDSGVLTPLIKSLSDLYLITPLCRILKIIFNWKSD